MAEIKPFGALRFTPKAGKIEQLTCPPYDIISEDERKEFLKTNEHNIIRLELPVDGTDPYKQANAVLNTWLEEKILESDNTPGLYLYKETFTSGGREHSVMGMVCMVKLEEFEKGVVLPHENTLSKAKTDRFNLMCATGCNFSSIYCLYFDDGGKIYPNLEGQAVGTPLLDFKGWDNVTHQVWRITDPEVIEKISGLFAEKKLYIADGHHRYETALNYRNHLRKTQGDSPRPADYVMMTLTNIEHPGLLVFPTHRVVRDIESFDKASLIDACREHFDVKSMSVDELTTEMTASEGRGEKVIGLVLPNEHYLLRLREIEVMKKFLPDVSQATRELDVSILHTLILERILGIDKENMANQINLFYTRVLDEALSAIPEGKGNCSFLLNATKVDEIAAVSAAGEKMPQKSTYFYPKLITGHLMAKIHS